MPLLVVAIPEAEWFALGGAFVLQLVLFARWLYRKMRDDEINRAFVRDIAMNHLPHLYSVLRQIAEANQIVLEEPPPIRFVQFSEDRNKKRW